MNRALKSQDVLAALKIVACGGQRPSYAALAKSLDMSPSEVHASVRRLQAGGLLHAEGLGAGPNISALEEFLIHGLKYVFPVERGGVVRGVPTSYAAPPLNRWLVLGEEPVPVWPHPGGRAIGVSFTPLYPTAASAALRDPVLYEYLALVDAVRAGRARDRRLAEGELIRRLRETRGARTCVGVPGMEAA